MSARPDPLLEIVPPLDDPLDARLAKAGLPEPAAGNTPILLNAPGRVLYIAQGEVDLFLVALADGVPHGARHFFGSLRAGDLLFGVDDGAGMAEVGLLAVGVVGTSVVPLHLDAVARFAQSARHAAALAAKVDRWIGVLSEGASQAIVPAPRVDVVCAPGEALTAEVNQRLGVAHGVCWTILAGGSPLFLDAQDLPGADRGIPVPLSPASWIVLGETAAVSCHDTVSLLADGRAWPGLAMLHSAVIEAAPMTLRFAAVDEANRLRARGDANRRAREHGSNELVALVSTPVRPSGPADEADALLRACQIIGATMGVAVRAPLHRGDGSTPLTLEAILRASGLRRRQVALESGWWRDDVGSFLLLRKTGGPPAVVLREGAGYVLHDPATNGRTRLDARAAAALEGVGILIYEPLPNAAVSTRDLVKSIVLRGRHEFAAIAGFGVAGGILGMGVPLGLSYITDTIIPGNDRPALIELAVVLFVVAALQLLVALTIQRSALRLEGWLGNRLQAAILDRLLRLPVRFFRAFKTGDLAVRALAVRKIQDVLTGTLIASIMAGVYAIVSFGLMFFLSPLLGAVALLLVIAMFAAMIALGLRRVRHEREIVGLRGEIASKALELGTGISKLRLAGAQDRAYGRWARQYAELIGRASAAQRVEAAGTILTTASVTASQAVLFAVIVYAGMEKGGGLGLGTMVAFLAAYGQAVAGISQLSVAVVALMALRPVIEHAGPILQAVPEAHRQALDPGELSGAIEISHVGFRYNDDAPAVFSDLSVQIRPGEFIALVGPSGCGKSTILRLLLGFEAPQQGGILFDGKDLRGLDVSAVRRQCGVVLQNGRLSPGSLLENILGGNLHLTEADAWRAAEQAGMDNDLRSMPMGMHTVVSDGQGLSGGQVQRVLIARAIVHRPRILMLDEATSALDNQTQAIVKQSLDKIQATKIVIAHRLSTVMDADRVIVLRDGRVIEEGSYQALMQQPGFFAELAARQLT